MPSRLSRVVAQVNAVGVAKDRAQGQVATNTDKVIQKASSVSRASLSVEDSE